MTSSARFVAQWWSYKTRHQSCVLRVATQCKESGHPLPLSLMAQDGVVKDDLSKYKAHKWYGAFKDESGNIIKLEGTANDTV